MRETVATALRDQFLVEDDPSLLAKACSTLVQLLADPSWSVRIKAVNSLEGLKVRTPEAMQGLITTLTDPDVDVRKATAKVGGITQHKYLTIIE